MKACSRCVILPGLVPDTGQFVLAPPTSHTLGILRAIVLEQEHSVDEPWPGILRIALVPEKLNKLVEAMAAKLGALEMQDTKTLLLAPDAEITLADLPKMQSLGAFSAQVLGEWFLELLRENRLTTHFQPIFHANDPSQIFAFECLTRGLDLQGGLIPPLRLYEAARDVELIFQLDRAARIAAIHNAAAAGLAQGQTRLFVNFNPTSVYDPVFCLQSTISAINKAGFRPDQVVFEIVESDQIKDIPHLLRITEFYRNAGFQIALDDLGSGYGSLCLLGQLRPDFVKLDMELIRNVDQDPFKAGITGKLLEMAQALDIPTVAEGIETEAEGNWLRDQGADYLQGYLFARPSPSPLSFLPQYQPEPAAVF